MVYTALAPRRQQFHVEMQQSNNAVITFVDIQSAGRRKFDRFLEYQEKLGLLQLLSKFAKNS